MLSLLAAEEKSVPRAELMFSQKVHLLQGEDVENVIPTRPVTMWLDVLS